MLDVRPIEGNSRTKSHTELQLADVLAASFVLFIATASDIKIVPFRSLVAVERKIHFALKPLLASPKIAN